MEHWTIGSKTIARMRSIVPLIYCSRDPPGLFIFRALDHWSIRAMGQCGLLIYCSIVLLAWLPAAGRFHLQSIRALDNGTLGHCDNAVY